MSYNVRLVDLVANALIAIKEEGKNITFLAFSALEEYGARVVHYLKEKGKDAVLLLSRDRTDDFFDTYRDLFQESEENGEHGVIICKQVTSDELIRRFWGYLPLDLLQAFIEPDNVKALGIIA